jgi:hypothetical protein
MLFFAHFSVSLPSFLSGIFRRFEPLNSFFLPSYLWVRQQQQQQIKTWQIAKHFLLNQIQFARL